MTETIWAVAAGEYSDYRIECLCRTETEAQAVADRPNDNRGWGYHYVEDFPLLTPDDVHQQTTLALTGTLVDGAFTDGDTHSTTNVVLGPEVGPAGHWTVTATTSGGGHLAHAAEWLHRSGIEDDAPYPKITLSAHGNDPEQVRHVYSDKRAQLLAHPDPKMLCGQGLIPRRRKP